MSQPVLPAIRIPKPMKFDAVRDLEEPLTLLRDVIVVFHLKAAPGEIVFYECECGKSSISSLDLDAEFIPESMIEEMSLHVMLNH